MRHAKDGVPATAMTRRLLVWRAGALGDTLTLLPALAALHARYPGATLDAVGSRAYLQLIREAGLADRIWDAGDPLFAGLFRPGADERTEGVPVSSVEIPLAAWLEGIEVAIVWSSAASMIGAHLRARGIETVVTASPLPSRPQPIAAYLLACLAPLGIPARLPDPLPLHATTASVAATEEAWRVATRVAGGRGTGSVVVLHPGAGGAFKCWPLTSFLALAGDLRRHGHGVVWTCGPADQRVAGSLRAAREPAAAVLEGHDLPALCALLARAAAVVAPDTGVAHLSAGLGRPTLVLFGPTDERLWAPVGARVAVLRSGACSRPPALPRAQPCAPGPCCLRDLTVAEVGATVRQMLP